jgi:hypothetical protein
MERLQASTTAEGAPHWTIYHQAERLYCQGTDQPTPFFSVEKCRITRLHYLRSMGYHEPGREYQVSKVPRTSECGVKIGRGEYPANQQRCFGAGISDSRRDTRPSNSLYCNSLCLRVAYTWKSSL